MTRATPTVLQDLRARIARLEGPDGGENRDRLAFDVSAVDGVLGGGLERARVHELAGDAADGFVTALLARTGGNTAIWVSDQRTPSRPYPPGLSSLGLDPARVVFVACRSRDDILWAMEEALSCGAAGAVVAEVHRHLGGTVDLTASRRLQLAAEKGGAIGFVLTGSGHEAAVLAPNALSTRWLIRAAPSHDGGGTGEGERKACWHVALCRQRMGETGQWMVEWHGEARTFSLVSDAQDGSAIAGESVPAPNPAGGCR